MRMTSHAYVPAAILLVTMLLGGCSGTEQGALGSKENPIRIYFTPSVDAEEVLVKSEHFTRLLERETGYSFVCAVPTSYLVLVESFGTRKCDVACMNSFGYLLAHDKYGAQARLRVVRNGDSSYRGMIIARANSGISKIQDLNGRKFAFTDPASTSGNLLPRKLFRQHGIAPGEELFAMRHDNVVTMVYQGKVDAGACFYSPPDQTGRIRDARARVAIQFPDVEQKVRMIAFTEAIPNDPIVFRKDLPEQVKERVEKGLLKLVAAAEGRAAFRALYAGDGLIAARDNDYASLRDLMQFSGKSSQEFMGM
jgi:phosphonate transport system substrate-binding protein